MPLELTLQLRIGSIYRAKGYKNLIRRGINPFFRMDWEMGVSPLQVFCQNGATQREETFDVNGRSIGDNRDYDLECLARTVHFKEAAQFKKEISQKYSERKISLLQKMDSDTRRTVNDQQFNNASDFQSALREEMFRLFGIHKSRMGFHRRRF